MQKIPGWKRALSYLFPIRLKTYHSGISGEIQLNLYLGKKILDTAEVNYSFGSLHSVMYKSIRKAFQLNADLNKVLLLGFGGGSAARIIRHSFNPDAAITAVELDPLMKEIALQEFDAENIHFVMGDAMQYIRDKNEFDLIVCDVFIGKTMPSDYWENDFYLHIKNNLAPGGIFILNSIFENADYKKLAALFETHFPGHVLLKIYDGNYVFIGNRTGR